MFCKRRRAILAVEEVLSSRRGSGSLYLCAQEGQPGLEVTNEHARPIPRSTQGEERARTCQEQDMALLSGNVELPSTGCSARGALSFISSERSGANEPLHRD